MFTKIKLFLSSKVSTNLFIFVEGILVGGVAVSIFFINSQTNKPFSEKHTGGYKLINPLLECEIDEGQGRSEITPIDQAVESRIKSHLAKGAVREIAYYFRELNNGHWFGYNEDDAFTPASLLKVPAMVTLFKMEEREPGFLQTEITVAEGSEMPEQQIEPKQKVEIGKKYTIDELIRRTIVYSDNLAFVQLYDVFPLDIAREVYRFAGILYDKQTFDSLVTVKNYSSFFRILYNASYLSPEYSEKALSYLTEADFTEGVVAGVPENITIASKFGERSTASELKQLHECGIVYHPKHPYLICMMTRGDDFGELAAVIKDLSQLTFQEVDKNNKRL